MSEQTRKTSSTKTSGGETETQKTTLNDKGRKLGKELDALIDEIDGLLEENAAEFVNSYIQRGGQ